MNEKIVTAVGSTLSVRVYLKGMVFTIVYMDNPVPNCKNLYKSLSVDGNSVNAGTASPGALLGKRVTFDSLPQSVQEAIKFKVSTPTQIRCIHAQRARKLRRRGVAVWWDNIRKSLVWERSLTA